MEKKLNYPVKYAVLELKTDGGWDNNYEDVTVGFITSKCYVIGQNVRYYQDGSCKVFYQVVFPYNDIYNYRWRTSIGYPFTEKEIIPSFGYHGNCTNENIVSNVFESFEEASVAADVINKERRDRVGYYLSVAAPDWEEKYNNLLEEFDKNLAICKSYEQAICDATSDMVVTGENIAIKQLIKKDEE